MPIRNFKFGLASVLNYCLFSIIAYEVLGGWIDPDTPYSKYKTNPLVEEDKRKYRLVFSDEFEVDNRTFADGEDPKWTAINKNDYTNQALHYYSAENAKTSNGKLRITTDFKDNIYKAFDEHSKKYYIDTKHVQSGMLQGWNKFCMTGGIIEISAKLPGEATTGGLWPALWLLGNLARASYVGSSDWVWPYSYNKCNEKVHFSQERNACRKDKHYGMAPGVGRGAPEIDILEAMAGEPGPLPNTPIQRPYFSSSLQIAPGLKKDRPFIMRPPKKGKWYEGLEYGNETGTSLNPFFYGVTLVHEPKKYTYQSDAISANTHVDKNFFTNQQIYRVEWDPPEEDGSGGYIRWFVNNKLMFGIKGESLNLTGTEIPSEPMYVLLNTAVSTTWGFPIPCPEGCDCACFDCKNSDCTCGLPTGYCDNFPAYFDIDYVRVWQASNEKKHQVGCSTKQRPTDLFIEGHKERYMEAGDKTPLKPIMNGGAECKSNDDCGGSRYGFCSSHGACSCHTMFTGPKCLAHAGFDDFPYEPEQTKIVVFYLRIPTFLAIAFSMLLLGLCAVFALNIIENNREKLYIEEQSFIRREIQKQNFLFHRAATYGFPTYGAMGSDDDAQYQTIPSLRQPRSIPEGIRSYVLIDEELLP